MLAEAALHDPCHTLCLFPSWWGWSQLSVVQLSPPVRWNWGRLCAPYLPSLVLTFGWIGERQELRTTKGFLPVMPSMAACACWEGSGVCFWSLCHLHRSVGMELARGPGSHPWKPCEDGRRRPPAEVLGMPRVLWHTRCPIMCLFIHKYIHVQPPPLNPCAQIITKRLTPSSPICPGSSFGRRVCLAGGVRQASCSGAQRHLQGRGRSISEFSLLYVVSSGQSRLELLNFLPSAAPPPEFIITVFVRG